MAVIPSAVSSRLAVLAATAGSLQSPNFNVSDVDFHSLRDAPGQATEGMWSVDGDEFVFSVVGQLSANHTFLGEYGDMISLLGDDNSATYGQLTRAKWKLAIVVAAALEQSGDKEILQRQMTHLRALQERSCDLLPLKKGTAQGLSVVYSWKMGERTTISSDNIYAPTLLPEAGEYAAADWPDSRKVFSGLIDDRKDKLVVRPLELYDSNGTRVDMRKAVDVFRPGSWVEVVCALKMWDTSECVGSGRGVRRQAVRTFQLYTGSAQLLVSGRLDEGTLNTRPRPTSLKRSFGPVGGDGGNPGPKMRRTEDGSDRPPGNLARDVDMHN